MQKPFNFFELFYGPTTGEDLMMEAIFHNPPPTSEEDWNYGFLLRNAEGNVYRWLVIDSNGEWVRKLHQGEDQTTLFFGNSRISNLDQTTGGKNKLRQVIIGERALTFINGKFQDSSDLSAIQGVAPVTLVVNDLGRGRPSLSASPCGSGAPVCRNSRNHRIVEEEQLGPFAFEGLPWN